MFVETYKFLNKSVIQISLKLSQENYMDLKWTQINLLKVGYKMSLNDMITLCIKNKIKNGITKEEINTFKESQKNKDK